MTGVLQGKRNSRAGVAKTFTAPPSPLAMLRQSPLRLPWSWNSGGLREGQMVADPPLAGRGRARPRLIRREMRQRSFGLQVSWVVSFLGCSRTARPPAPPSHYVPRRHGLQRRFEATGFDYQRRDHQGKRKFYGDLTAACEPLHVSAKGLVRTKAASRSANSFPETY